jgi:hypothetical protein
MELLKAPLILMNNKKKKTKRAVKRTPEFPKKISRRRTDGRTENSQKISLFQIFLKIECSRVPIHFKVAAAGAAHPLRDKKFYFFNCLNFFAWASYFAIIYVYT